MSWLLVGVGVYAALIAFLYLQQRSLMYHPDPTPLPAPAGTLLDQAKVIRLQTDDHLQLTSWYVPPKDGHLVVVYFQGNAGSIAGRDAKARRVVDTGHGILLVSYRGYGGNPGRPSEEGLYADARAAMAYLQRDGIAAGRRVVWGESLGAGVAVEMAFEAATAGQALAGVILEAPFTSMGQAAQDHYPYVPAKWLVRDRFDSLSNIAAIGAPLLIMHGDADRVIRESHGRALFAAAKEPKQGFWAAGGGHNDLEDFGAGQTVLTFLAGLRR